MTERAKHKKSLLASQQPRTEEGFFNGSCSNEQNPIHAREIAEPYPCKFEADCRVSGVFVAARYCCNHGGGTGCKAWRRLTDLWLCKSPVVLAKLDLEGA